MTPETRKHKRAASEDDSSQLISDMASTTAKQLSAAVSPFSDLEDASERAKFVAHVVMLLSLNLRAADILSTIVSSLDSMASAKVDAQKTRRNYAFVQNLEPGLSARRDSGTATGTRKKIKREFDDEEDDSEEVEHEV